MLNQNLKYWVALKWVEGVGNVGFKALLEAFGTPQKVFEAPLSMIKAVPGIGDKTAPQIKSFKDWKKVEKELEFADRTCVSIVTLKKTISMWQSSDPGRPAPTANSPRKDSAVSWF